MSLFFTAKTPAATRSWTAEPEIPSNGSLGLTANFTRPLDTRHAESSLRQVAVWSSVNLLAGLVASLPLDGFTGQGPDKRPIALPVFFTDPDGTGQGMPDWLYQLMVSWLLRGNTVGDVVDRDGMGRPTQVMLLHPDQVGLFEGKDGPRWSCKGKPLVSSNVWHRRAYPVPGSRLGLSPIALHAQSIGMGLAAGAYGLRWFMDGAHPSAILSTDEELDEPKARTVKARFMAAIRGRREPVVLGNGWKYQAVQVSAGESMFLDTQRYSAAECARIFGPGLPEVLGYDTGGSLTYSNVEQRSLDLLKFTLDRWLVMIEQILSADMLARPRYVRFNRGALLRTDLLTRYRAHEIALRNKFEVVNEVRDLEDLSPVDWGDEPTSAAPAPVAVKVEE
jgi:HK97 family phage portal protein